MVFIKYKDIILQNKKILDAPCNLALSAAINPTEPGPNIAIVSPGLKPDCVTSPHPVGNISSVK